MDNTLLEILAHKRLEVQNAKRDASTASVKEAVKRAPPTRDFLKALRNGSRSVHIIAECKRQSPSKGLLVKGDYRPHDLAKSYERGGASAISVLTDERFFGGHLSHLRGVAAGVSIPILRKDFVIDAYQIYEARAATADSFLLLAGVLSTSQLNEFIEIGRSLGMEPLVESHSESDLDLALASSATILGINNRNLKTFHVSLEYSQNYYQKIASRRSSAVAVCESGIKSRKDVELMRGVGYKCFLIGEALLTHPDPEQAVRDLLL